MGERGAIRSDVVGSLLRPAYLVEARQALEADRGGAWELKRIEDRAVDEAVRLQEEAGLDVLTDGELRRYAFFGHLIEALDGFDKLGGWAIPFRDEQGGRLVFKRPVVVDKERRRQKWSWAGGPPCAMKISSPRDAPRARTRRTAVVPRGRT